MKNRLLLGVTLVLLLLAASGCDSSNPIAPAGTVLTVTANPTLIGLNGLSTLTISGFRPDGNPLNPGTQVTLSTTLGVLSASTIAIGQTGTATATLRGNGQIGSATVTAATPTGDAMATADIQIGETPDTKPTLILSVSPNTIGLNEEATVTAEARNADGTPFGAGGIVSLQTDLGLLGQTSLTTDANSRVTTTLSSGSQSGTATITATIGASDPFMVTVLFENQPPALLLEATPGVIAVGGISTITITARDFNGNPLGSGERITLSTTRGAITSPVFTNSAGQATATLEAGNQPGDATITATLGNSEQATVSVTIENRTPNLILTINPTDIAINEEATVTIVARDQNNLPLGSGERIQLFTTLGTFPQATDGIVTTNGNGVAETTLRAGNQSGTATVTAILGSSTPVTQDVTIRDVIANFEFTSPDLNIDPPGQGSTTGESIDLDVRVQNALGQGLNNIRVNFASPDVGGTFAPNSTLLTDVSGTGRVTLTVTDAQIPSSSTIPSFTVQATVVGEAAPGVEKTLTLTVTINR